MPRYFFVSNDYGIWSESFKPDYNDSDNTRVLQGYSDRNSVNENLLSLLFFNTTAIRSSLSGQRIIACALDFDVEAFGESGDTANMVFGTHNYPQYQANIVGSRINSDRLRLLNVHRGTYTEFALGTIIGTEFRDGVSTGIALGRAPNKQEIWRSGIVKPGYSTGPVLVIDTVPPNQAPFAPVLQVPSDSAVIDTYNLSTQFKWAASDPDGDPQAAWHFRRTKPDGSFDYWNGTAFVANDTRLTQSTAPLSNGAMSIPAGVWANGSRFGWSVATEDPAGLIGPFSSARTIYTATAPVVTVVQPSQYPTVSRPTIQWTYSSIDTTPQFGWAAQIVEQSVYSNASYNPDNYLGEVWSGSANGTATSVSPNVDLVNHKTYRAYVRVYSSPNPSGGVQYSSWQYTQFTIAVPPAAPKITYPRNGANIDLAAGFSIVWADTFFNNAGSQTGFAIRRNTAGGTYQYWDGSAWSATEKFLAGVASSYAFRTNEVNNGVTYTFSVAIRDDYSSISPYSTGNTVTGTSAVQVSVLSPLGAVSVNNPIVTWSEYQPENYPQQTWQVRIIEQSVYTAAGVFDPGAAVAVWDSFETMNAFTRTVAVPINLVNQRTYRAFVRLKVAGIYSSWAYAEFLIAITAPAVPSVTTIVRTDDGAIDVHIQGRDSMLSEEASRNAWGWHSVSNCTLQSSQFFQSAQSELMSTLTCSATGTMTANTYYAYTVASGQMYTAAATLIAQLGATPVNGYVSLEFYDITSTILTVSSAQIVLDSSAVRSIISAVAPPLATSAKMRITYQSVPNIGDKHSFFDPVLRPGVGDEWSPGGTLGSTFISLTEAYSGRLVRYARGIPVPIDTQQVVVRDEDVPIGRAQSYSATTQVVHPSSSLVSNPGVASDVTWTSGWLWISDPARSGSGYAFAPQSFSAVTRPAAQGKFRAVGRSDAIITTGVRGLREGSYTIITHTRADRDAHLDLMLNSDILLLRVPPDTFDPTFTDIEGETIYVRTDGDLPEGRPLAIRTPHRTITQGWTEQLPPLHLFDFSDS